VKIDASGLSMIRRHKAAITQFQVFGERGSGTNVIRRSMELNLEAQRVETLGWKHGFPHMVGIPNALLVVCVVRHPWDWARSMFARPWHAHPGMQKLGFDAFIRHPWLSIVDRPTDFEELHDEIKAFGTLLQMDLHPISGRPFANLMALRNAKLAALRGFEQRNCNLAFLRLEPFQADPEGMITRLAEGFEIPRKGAFQPVNRRMGTRFTPSVPDRPPPPEQMSDENAAFLRETLDLDQEAALGYAL